MSDETVEVFQRLRELRKERHREWHRSNMDFLQQSGFTWESTNHGETLLFRGEIKADFFPSTGRWRSEGKTYSGGARKFIEWLEGEEEF